MLSWTRGFVLVRTIDRVLLSDLRPARTRVTSRVARRSLPPIPVPIGTAAPETRPLAARAQDGRGTRGPTVVVASGVGVGGGRRIGLGVGDAIRGRRCGRDDCARRWGGRRAHLRCRGAHHVDRDHSRERDQRERHRGDLDVSPVHVSHQPMRPRAVKDCRLLAVETERRVQDVPRAARSGDSRQTRARHNVCSADPVCC